MLPYRSTCDTGDSRNMSDSQGAEVRVYVIDLIGKPQIMIEADEVRKDDTGDVIFLRNGIERGRYVQGQFHGYRDVTDDEVPFDPPFVLS